MAIPRQRHDRELEDLIQRAAAEAKRLNPHPGVPSRPFTDEEIAEILASDKALEALWNSPEGQRAQALGHSAADAVSEDRGNRAEQRGVTSYFFDSSAIVKRYHVEVGTPWVRSICDPRTHPPLYLSQLAQVEGVAALRR